MKIAVTGANGYFGKILVQFLREKNFEVKPSDLFSGRPEEGAVNCDVRDLGHLVSVFQGCDAVVHLAAFPSPWTQPDAKVYQDNTVGSYNVLLACELLGIKKICQASSINAIGGVYSRLPTYDYFPVDEEHPTYSEDPYSLSKWILEIQGDCFARRRDETSLSAACASTGCSIVISWNPAQLTASLSSISGPIPIRLLRPRPVWPVCK